MADTNDAFMLPDDFPKTQLEFEAKFATEEACIEYLTKLRWPTGFACPACSAPDGWPLKTRPVVECRYCGKQTSLTAGTVLHGTRKPLRLWFRAMFHMAGQKAGLSALNFQRLMGMASYQTAWTWLHKLRRAMVRPDRPKLEGTVEVDETFVGGVVEGCAGRGSTNPQIAVAVEIVAKNGKKVVLGRVRMDVIEDATEVSLSNFVSSNVEKGATVRTDGLPSYEELKEFGFRHRPTVVGDPKRASKLFPGVNRVISLLKRWLIGTHQGAVSEKHLVHYLNEFTFRFNRRWSSCPTKLFHRLAEQVVRTPPTGYRKLVQSAPEPRFAT